LDDEELAERGTRMSSDKDIYQILESLDAAQKSVKQLPALFRPVNTSPQLSGKYPGKNATRGYMVGESTDDFDTLIDRYIDLDYALRELPFPEDLDPEEYAEKVSVEMDSIKEKIRAKFGNDAARRLLKRAYDINYHSMDPDEAVKVYEGDESVNPMAQAVIRRIANQHPEWLMKYGPEAVMQAVDDVTEGDTDWEEIGSSDVSAYVNYVRDALRDRMGSREEMADRRPFAEHDGRDDEEEEIDDDGMTMADRARRDGRGEEPETVSQQRKKSLQATRDFNRGRRADAMREQGVVEGAETATEDVLSTMKKKLGDYLQDVATAIKKDPDLIDQIPSDVDQIRSVKTIKTDDGHEIKIHGNEDDGFRISIKNRDAKTKFRDLDEATMAVEMYCARRRAQALEADYIDEKTS
jgi:hypothetical protein